MKDGKWVTAGSVVFVYQKLKMCFNLSYNYQQLEGL